MLTAFLHNAILLGLLSQSILRGGRGAKCSQYLKSTKNMETLNLAFELVFNKFFIKTGFELMALSY